MVAAFPLSLTYLQRGLFYGETPAEVNMYALSALGLYDDYETAMRNPYFIAGQSGGNAGWTFASMATFLRGLPTSLNISWKPVGVPVMTSGGALASEMMINVPVINAIGGSTELVLIGTAGLASNWSMMSGGGITQGHHPWPMYLGGPKKQPLLNLPKDLHEKFHAGLDMIFPRSKGNLSWNSLSPTEQRDILESLMTYCQDFDADFGTHTLDAVLKSLKSAGITPP